MCDQIILHDLAYLPRDHLELRRLVIASIPGHPDFSDWIDNAVGFELEDVDEEGNVIVMIMTEEEKVERRKSNEVKMAKFLLDHAQPQAWTDDSGVFCQVI